MAEDLPVVYRACLAYLVRDKTLREEGLFRVSGSLSRINELAALYDKGKYVDLQNDCLDPATVCGLLKSSLKKYQLPLLKDDAVAITDAASDPDDASAKVQEAIGNLSPGSSILLCALSQLLDMIVKEPDNKMLPANISKSMGPTLFPGVKNKMYPPTVEILTGQWSSLWPQDILDQAAVLLTEPERVESHDAGCCTIA